MVIEYTATEEKKVSKLIASLIDRTQKKKVKWERTVPRDRFMAALYPYSVSIRRVTSLHSDATYSLDMLNADEGQVVTLRNEFIPDQGDYDMLRELFFLAKSSASPPIEEGVDKLLQELERR